MRAACRSYVKDNTITFFTKKKKSLKIKTIRYRAYEKKKEIFFLF